MLPRGNDESMYRLVLQHDDFGIHNMSISLGETGQPEITSVYDWETGCIVPAILTEVELAVSGVDYIMDENGDPDVVRHAEEGSEDRRQENIEYANLYLKVSVLLWFLCQCVQNLSYFAMPVL